MTIVLAPSEKSARKAKGDGHLRRAEILSAAERIFIAQGYEGATIRKIADEVGVSSTALYMHFHDKDQILLEICDRAMSELLAINLRISTRPGDPVARVRDMLEAYMRFALDNPNAYRLMFCAASMANSPRRRDATLQLGDRCFEKFSGVVGEIAAHGRPAHRRCADGDPDPVGGLPRPDFVADRQARFRMVAGGRGHGRHARGPALRPGQRLTTA